MSVLESVSERKATRLAELGVESVLDLVTTYPRRYIDRTRQADVSGLEVGDEAAVLATVHSARSRRARNGRAVVELTVRDDTGRLAVVFFNQPWRAKQLEAGTEAIFFGKVGEYRGARQMVNPVVDVVAGVTPGRRTLRILPVYPASAKAGLTSWEIGEFVEEALARAGELADPLPPEWRSSLAVWERTEAFRAIHAPESLAVVEPARRRLVFDELFRLQLALVLRRRAFEVNARALHHDVSPREVTGSVVDTLVRALLGPAALRAHEGAAASPGGDRGRHGRPLPDAPAAPGRRRLGQDRRRLGHVVGRGAERAPGRAHGADRGVGRAAHLGGAALLGDLEGPGGMGGGEVRVELLTSRVKGKARAVVLDGLASGDVGIVVGTHALLTEEVAFGSLGCVVIDEQHRFGVEQRATLRSKGADGDPDLLVMTATPIPRTAAMVIFGDLDLTTLDELPPGRNPVDDRVAAGGGAWRPGPGLGTGAVGGGGGSPRLRRLPAGRGVACGSRRSRRPRSSSGCPPANWPA